MPAPKWNRLTKINRDIFQLDAEKDPRVVSKTFQGVNFSQFAFDDAEERLVAVDTRGYVYDIDLRRRDELTYKKFEKFGIATCLAFNPLEKSEIIIATTTNNIAIHRLNIDDVSSPVAQISAHRCAVSHLSFYENYCLSSSIEDAVIWDLRTLAIMHRLRLDDGAKLKKSLFSNRGDIATLYYSDVFRIWPFENFQEETRVSLQNFGARNFKDFTFTRNSRAIVFCAARGGIIILDSAKFDLLVKFNSNDDNFVPRKISLVPQSLNFGVNEILAIHCSDATLKFFNIEAKSFIEPEKGCWRGIKNFGISSQGRWLVCIESQGNLSLRRMEKIQLGKLNYLQKTAQPMKHKKAHKIESHLRSVENDMKEELCIDKLLPILEEFGEYPEKHRIVIWRTLIKLPSNRNAFIGLTEKIRRQDLVKNIGLEEYRLADRSKSNLLASTIDYLVRWCPLLAQCRFLPSLVFPFIVVFQKYPLLALEVSIAILSNFCQKWFEYHPLPPLNVLGIVENVLLESDPALLTYFCEHGITSTDYAWPLLRTALSEVLATNDWIILWDHLFTYQRASMLIMCVVAYSICSREIVISLLRKPNDFRRFYSSQGNVNVKQLLKVARRIDSNTPRRIHPNRYLRDNFVILPKDGPYPPFLMHEYPKFLTEQHIDLAQLHALEEEEKMLREYRQKAIKIAEEKRLRTESESFVKEIHRNRMNELRKCYEEQMRLMKFNVENARDEIRRCASISGETSLISTEYLRSIEKSKSAENTGRSPTFTTSTQRTRSNSCEELSDQVRELESEVQQFLGDLRNKSSVDIR